MRLCDNILYRLIKVPPLFSVYGHATAGSPPPSSSSSRLRQPL